MKWWIVPVVLAAVAGCDDLDEFKTQPGPDGSKFLGCVVGSVDDSFIRGKAGFEPGTWMELRFDPTEATVVSEANQITAEGVEFPEPTPMMPMPDPITHRYFDATPLRPIPTLSHDALSGYDFPGGGRIRNYIFVATPSGGPLADQHTMVFLSLMENGRIEVRVLHDAPVTGLETERRGYFGLFRLAREDAAEPPSCDRFTR